MAFGNMGYYCGTGVAFTRNPATGEKGLMGEFLMNAQGEDVVAGVRTPMPIAKMAEIMPEVFDQFKSVCSTLENHYRDMQDMEFTIEDKHLYMLQTRNGKRTAKANSGQKAFHAPDKKRQENSSGSSQDRLRPC